jgi:putative holliday junction resolvase
VQQKETLDPRALPEISDVPTAGRILAIDPGTKRVGLAITDETRAIATPLKVIDRTSWKKLLSEIKAVIGTYDAAAVVVGLPLNTDGSESFMSKEARDIAHKLGLSIGIPVYLQDERVTSYEARGRLWERGIPPDQTKKFVDSEAAAIILTDFLDRLSKNG